MPRFYLKTFSRNETSIGLFNIKNARLIERANLRNQCYRHYFYGKEISLETPLGTIEQAASGILRTLMASGSVENQSEEHNTLLLYILLQYGRTTYAADTVDELTEKFTKHLLSQNFSKEDIDRVRIRLKQPAQLSVALCLLNYPIIMDLQLKIIRISGPEEFITSDNPVVLYNQLFRFRTDGSDTGLASRGLQAFFPISPGHLAMLYDADVYAVGRDRDSVIDRISPMDVDQLNILQLVSADENIYFRTLPANLRALHSRAQRYLRRERTTVRIFVQEETQTNRRELVASTRSDVRTDLDLSFVRIRRRAIQWRKKFMTLKAKPVAIARDPQLMKYHDEYTKLVFRGKAEASDFFEWLQTKLGRR